MDFDKLREERFARLSPEKQAWFKGAPGGGLREMGVEKVRELGKMIIAARSAHVPVDGVEMTDVEVPGPHGPIPMRIFRPAGGSNLGVHFNIHAGGYVMFGGLDTETARLSAMARDVDCVVVTPDFRMPPEHKFPVGIEECWAALQWTHDNIASHGGDGARIGVGGGCTGGVFSAVMALMARDAGLPLRYLYMAATVTDIREQYRSYYDFADGYTLTKDTANYVTSVYIRDDLDRFDWRASPILAESVRGLPPTLVVEGEWDVLHDEAKAWADRLRDAGVDVQFRVFPEEGHSLSPPAMAVADAEFQSFIKARLAA